MTYRHFSVNLIIQAILLALTPVIIALTWSIGNLKVIHYMLIVVYIVQVWSLIYTIRKTNRELARFIQSFGFGDTTIHFHNRDKDKSFGDLFNSFNQVVKAFRQLKMDKEKEYLFFENALKNIGVALLVVNEHGNVIMTNTALLKMLGIKYIHRIDKLDQFKSGLVNELLDLKPHQQKLVELMVDGRLLQVALTSVLMKQEKKVLRLLAFQDIRGEIEQKELESWQKLIRVLTHEVMNSLSPVNILSAGLKQRFEQNDQQIMDEEEKLEVIEALDAIHHRSKGLTRFVESYRGMAGLKSAQTNTCHINALLTRIQILFQDDMESKNINYTTEADENLHHLIDEKLIEQTLINLIKNSQEALDKVDCKIKLKATKTHGRLKISIADNGRGIPKEEIDKVCIPFYTTREGGNGIGLALSRQVMRLHGGQLKIHSEQSKGTVVSLLFD